MTDICYSVASQGDLPAIQSLLAQCGLLGGDIGSFLDNCIIAGDGSGLAGVVALEPYGRSALLRSLAVAPDWRGRALGLTLCARMIGHARLLGVEHLYLLTMNAERYFTAPGFKRIERGEAPAEIQATSQFHILCPDSAICMSRDITGEAFHACGESLRLRPDVPGARMWAVSLDHTMLTYFEVEPGSRFEPHSHRSEQITMVLSGELFFEVRGTVHCVRPGEVMAIPSSVVHAAWTQAAGAKAIDAWSPVMKKYESEQPGGNGGNAHHEDIGHTCSSRSGQF